MGQTTTATPAEPFGYSLNTSTIKGAGLPLMRELEIAADAGYGGVEPWIEEIEKHVQAGGTLTDLCKKTSDLGLKICGAVGFARWIVPDPQERKAGLEHMRRDMDLVAAIGGRHIACPPIGAHEAGHIQPTLDEIAERYHALLEVGRSAGVSPVLELWGFSKTLSKLSEMLYVAATSAQADTRLLLDSYHLHKGGSDINALELINGAVLPVFHINDYPATPARAHIDDSYRVYPGDGAAPLEKLFQILARIGFRGYLSVELFNRDYWKQPADLVAKTALEKTRSVVRKALAAR